MNDSAINNFEEYKPKLRAGQVIPQGSRIIYETNHPYDQIIVPVELVDVLFLCSGQFNVREIIEKVFKKQGVVHFKATFKLIHCLRDRGFLENGHLLGDKKDNSHTENLKTTEWPWIWNIIIGKRIVNNQNNPILFYCFSMILIAISLWSLLVINLSFESINKSADIPFGYLNLYVSIFFVNSVVLNIVNLTRALCLITLTGRIYNFSLKLSPIGFWFEAGDETQHLIQEKLYRFLFHLTIWLSPLAAYTALHYLPLSATFTEVLTLITTLHLATSINPLTRTPSQQLLKLTEGVHTAPLLTLSLWTSTLALLLYYLLSNWRWPVLTPLSINSITGWLLGGLTVLYFSYLLWKSVTTAHRDYLFPFALRVFHALTSKKIFSKTQQTIDELIEKTQDLPLFTYFPETLLRIILQQGELRNYPPRTQIIYDNDEANDLFILLDGNVEIFKGQSGQKQKLITLPAVTIFGESAIIEKSKRTADVYTRTGATVLKLRADVIRQAAIEAQCGREYEAFKNAMMVNQFFASAPYFRDLPKTTIELLTMKSRLHFLESEVAVFNQGQKGDAFYLIVRGSVDVVINNNAVGTIPQGQFFGEVSLIADIPRTASVITRESCVLLSISRETFWEVLTQHLELAMIIESICEKRILEDLSYHQLQTRPTGS